MDTAEQIRERASDQGGGPFAITFPGEEASGHEQDEEWCEVVLDGKPTRIRLHDYEAIFGIPGLYEQLFCEELECQSPRVVREVMAEVLETTELRADQLRVLDVGAGNGMVAEELADLGAQGLVGVDIVPEAASAAARDRPGLYDDYHVVDLTEIPASTDRALREADLNCIVCVAALGFGDIPPEAFAGAYDYVADGGLVGLSIKADFLSAEDDRSGFAELISRALDDGSLEVHGSRRFDHRLAADGGAIEYVALVAEKHGELPLSRQ